MRYNYGKRVRAGYLLAKSEEITHFEDSAVGDVWSVPSQTQSGVRYVVYRDQGGWRCQCKDNRLRGSVCKHTHAVRFCEALKRSRENSKLFSPYQDSEKVCCKYNKNHRIIRYGKPKGKQNYWCNDCERKFVPDDGFKKMKYDPVIITACLNLYFTTGTLRGIADHLYQIYGIKISHVSVLNWIKKYVAIISPFIEEFSPVLTTTWNADETMVKFGGQYKWIWNVLDRDSRFHIASIISESRNIRDARKVFSKAKSRTERDPRVIVTDAYGVYPAATRKEFFTRRPLRTKHLGNASIQGKNNNNVVERYHGRFKAKNKTQRGLKKTSSPIPAGQEMAYNWVTPHQGLDGMTPAEVAGIDLALGQNKWLGLIKKAKQHEVMANDSTKDETDTELLPKDTDVEHLANEIDNNPPEESQVREQANYATKEPDSTITHDTEIDSIIGESKQSKRIRKGWKNKGWL